MQPESIRLLRVVMLCGGLAAAQGCGFWRSVSNDRSETREARGNVVRLRKGDERRIVRVVRLDYPLLEGVEDAPEGPAAVVVNLGDFDEVEVYDVPRGLALTSVVAVLGLGAAVAAGVGIFYLSARRD